jgi:pimeloyl-ACP methyl ester carboxylesterase
MWSNDRRLVATAFVLWVCCGPVEVAPIPAGSGQQTVALKGLQLTVFTYRPNCADPQLLVVMHGFSRNADGYRDHARPIADRMCVLVVAPFFDKQRFPSWRYQHGGIVRNGIVQDPKQWTGNIILDLVDEVRKLEGRPLKYSIIGHSAGGQFLSRLAAFVPTEAQRIVVTNPGTHVFASLQVKAPYGLGAVYPEARAQAELRRYLVQPVTIFLGEADTGDEELDERPEAQQQGATRYERGLNAFKTAKSLAQASSWPFNWRLVELPGTGHSATQMFASRPWRHCGPEPA